MIEYINKKSGKKKIFAIGNPPYQEEDGGFGKSARPIYNHFISQLINSNYLSEFILVIPARWFNGGKGLDSFRKEMINSKQIKRIRYFENSQRVFPTVDVMGGICFLYWSKDFKGNTIVDTGNNTESKKIDLSKFDIIVPEFKAYKIIEKALEKSNKFLSDIVWSRNGFGLGSNYFKKNKFYEKGKIECFLRNKVIKKISKKLIPKNIEKIEEYKIAFPKAYGGGVLKPHHFFILEKNQITTETYTILESFKSKSSAKNMLKFLKTDFARFLLGLRKNTQNINRKTFSWIPLMNPKKLWTDEMLFKYFGINQEEKKYIKKKLYR